MANIPALQITSLSKSYGDTDALNDVSLTIEQGEIFGLLGPNGSGKTTLINCVAQLADRDTGSVSVMGLDVDADYNEVKKRVGLSLQEPNADPYFSIRRALIYQAGYFGIGRDTAEERVDSLLRQFDLYDKRSNTFRELSGGMQRKISLIKALLHEPDVLILDEPTAALDVEARVELWEHVRSVNEDGVTVLLTTHYIEEAEEMCERICFLRDGEVLRVSRTEDIMDELSRNCITILFDDDIPVLPESFPDHTVDEGRGAVEITVSRGEQSKRLQEVLEVLDKHNIDYRNFNIQEDRLEQIFRRMMQDE